MSLFGIDDNWKQDILLGGGAGAVFVLVQKVKSNFVIGMPNFPLVASNIENYLLKSVAAPVFEETTFRGIFLSYFTDGLKLNFHVANLVQAALFASFHWFVYYHGALQPQLLAALVFGVGMGYLTKHSKSLLPAMVCHAIFNAYLIASGLIMVGGM